MEKIVIEIDNPTAEVYKKFSPETRNRFGETVSIALKKIINDTTKESYKNFLDAISYEAEKNGLTEEILNDLLKANE